MQVVGVDVWNGTPAQLDAIFRLRTGVTFPLLLQGSAVGRAYGLVNEQYAIVDHRGVLRFVSRRRVIGFLDAEPIRRIVPQLIEERAAANTAVLDREPLPGRFSLAGNSPNPFNAQTAIKFQLDTAGAVVLDIFDMRGRLVRRLWQGPLAVGGHQLIWDGRNDAGQAVATGVYLYRLAQSEQVASRKMLLLR